MHTMTNVKQIKGNRKIDTQRKRKKENKKREREREID